MRRRKRPIVLLLLTGLALGPAASCRRGRGSAAPPVFSGAPIVLVSVDTLRSDHLPFYGYAGVETPALSALRNDAVLFERAYAHVPLTLPSHASVFTGLLPAGHGVRDNIGYRVDPSVPTIADLLGRAGYATGGAVSSVVLSGASGIGRGFQLWDDDVVPTRADQPQNRVQRAGDETEARLQAWLDVHGDRPFLAFLHLYEPHTPYEPREPFRSLYASAYDGEIATADASVGRLLAYLKAKGLYDRSLVIFLSDHGEGLGDHGEAEHGVFLYREDLQVPLLVKPPGGRGAFPASVATPVQLADVFTTIGEAVGLEGFHGPTGTVSLLATALSPAPAPRRVFAETFFPRIHFGWSELRSLIEGRWHYIEGPSSELFDLESDPAERHDLAAGRPAPLRTLRIAMEPLRTGFRPPAPADPEAVRRLASLGYISSGEVAGEGPLADPKAKIATVAAMRDAITLFTDGRFAEAVDVTGHLLAENPRMLDVWDLRSLALARLGRTEESLAALRKAVELAPPGSTHYLRLYASRCLEAGKAEAAVQHAGLAEELGDSGATEVLARALLAKGDLAGAAAAASRATEARETAATGSLVLAEIATRKGDLAGALELTDRAEAEVTAGSPAPAGLYLTRGDVLARMGRHAKAEEEFRREVRIHPTNYRGWEALVLLLAAEGKRDEAARTVADLVRGVPGVDSYLTAVRILSIVGDDTAAERWRREGATRFPEDPRLRGRKGAR